MDRRIKLVWQVLFLAFTVFFLTTRPVRLIRVEGQSMMPTYRHGQILVGTRFLHINRGDVVVFRDEVGDELIKRVRYVAGDSYHWAATSPANYIYLDEEYLNFIRKKIPDIHHRRYTVEKGRIWVLGDNASQSYDSRVFGGVNIDMVDYKILAAL